MNGRRSAANQTHTEGLKYALPSDAKTAESLEFSSVRLGQRNPQHCPHQESRVSEPSAAEMLGQPLDIRELAALLGCSAWTVRQRLLPAGLPHFRIARTGKLVFFENQIVRWILEKQRQKRGEIR